MDRKPRTSDGSDGLPPLAKTNKRAQQRKQGSLQTTSVPLTPQPRPLVDVAGSPTYSANRLPASRRSTQSDTGQCLQEGEQLALQLAPRLDRCVSSNDANSRGSSAGTAAEARAAAGFTAGPQHWPDPFHHLQQQQQHASSSQQHPAAAKTQQQQQLAAAGALPAKAAAPSPSASSAQPAGSSSSSAAAAAAASPGIAPAAAAAGGPGGLGGSSSSLQSSLSLESRHLDPPPSLWQFFHAEATPHDKYPTADVLWRQTERDRVYNFLLYVPYQLERIMIFGSLLCCYSFLGPLTILPLRCLRGLWQLLLRLVLPGPRAPAGPGGSSGGGSARLSGAQLYDVLCVLLLLGAVGVLSQIKPGVIYYWMKDITSEFLKIQVLFNALEILDKILSNFGVDVLEALNSTCTLFTRHSIGLQQLVADLLVAFLIITAHGAVLMCQAMVFAVTMNSKRNALLALMIATNFVELKGQVYKRTDTNKLWTLACQDIVERFQLLLVLSFVVVEDISNSGTWLPAPTTLLECARIYVWEVIIDVSKHAVLGKFNDIRPGIYREYMRDLCNDSLGNHSHNVHKLVGFCPMGPAALCLRMVKTLVTLKCDGSPVWSLRLAVLLAAWLGTFAFQVVLGFSLKWFAYLYVQHSTAQAGGKMLPRVINVAPSGTKLAAGAAAAAAAAAGVKPAAASAQQAQQQQQAAAAAGGSSSTAAAAAAGAGAFVAAGGKAPGLHLPAQTHSDDGMAAAATAAAAAGAGASSRRPVSVPGGRLPAASSPKHGSGSKGRRKSGANPSTGQGPAAAAGAAAAGAAEAAFSSSYAAPSLPGLVDRSRAYPKSQSYANMLPLDSSSGGGSDTTLEGPATLGRMLLPEQQHQQQQHSGFVALDGRFKDE